MRTRREFRAGIRLAGRLRLARQRGAIRGAGAGGRWWLSSVPWSSRSTSPACSGRSHAGSARRSRRIPQEFARHLRRSAPRGRRGTCREWRRGSRAPRSSTATPANCLLQRRDRARDRGEHLRRDRGARGHDVELGTQLVGLASAALRPARASPCRTAKCVSPAPGAALPVPDHVQLRVHAAQRVGDTACCRSTRACRP